MERSEWPEDLKRLVAHAEEINWPGTILIGGSRAIPWIEHPRDWDIILVSTQEIAKLLVLNRDEYPGLDFHVCDDKKDIINQLLNHECPVIYGKAQTLSINDYIEDLLPFISYRMTRNTKYLYRTVIVLLWLFNNTHNLSIEQQQLINNIHDHYGATPQEVMYLQSVLNEVKKKWDMI